jgi:hypothetical protein
VNDAGTRPVRVNQTERMKLLAAIDRLPQRSRLEPANVERWIETVLQNDPDRALWHVRRLGGIGGSEIGPLVIAKRGGFSALGSEYDLVVDKLMMYPPMPPKDNMRRGQDIEDLIRMMFAREYQARSLEKDLEFLRGSAHPDVPWMVGSPDDVILLPNGKRYLADYKSPGEETLDGYERKNAVALEYVCQLHQYHDIGNAHGLAFDGMLLVSLDWKRWRLDVRVVEYDKTLAAEMIAVGSHVWNEYVLKGDLPPKRVRQPVLPSGEKQEELSHLAGQFLIARSLEKVGKEAADTIAATLIDCTADYNLGEDKLSLGGVDVAEKLVVDEEEVERRLARHGRSIAEFETRGAVDSDALAGFLHEHEDVADLLEKSNCFEKVVNFESAITTLAAANEDVSGCYIARHTPKVSLKKKGADAECVEVAMQAAREALSGPLETDVTALLDEFKARRQAEKQALEDAVKAKAEEKARKEAERAAKRGEKSASTNASAQGDPSAGSPDASAASAAAAPKPRRMRAAG